MALRQTTENIQDHDAVALRDRAGMTDGELLGSFVRQKDDAALAALVQRHGPMVWGVCRRVACSYHDAEDAFQATFLVLVRKAATIRDKETVGNWLYGVARRTALKARSLTAKRSVRERQLTDMDEPAVTEQDLWNDLRVILDQELTQLPEKYRVLIVLCDLEGKTRKEAARQLGCPEGTVAGRLARARVMLSKRLARRALTVSGGALAVLLAQNAASACVPMSVVSSTVKAASLFAAGQATAGVIAANVAVLTKGMLKTMLLAKVKIALVVVLAGSLFVSTVALSAAQQNKRAGAAVNQRNPRAVAPVKAQNSRGGAAKGQNAQNGGQGDNQNGQAGQQGDNQNGQAGQQGDNQNGQAGQQGDNQNGQAGQQGDNQNGQAGQQGDNQNGQAGQQGESQNGQAGQQGDNQNGQAVKGGNQNGQAAKGGKQAVRRVPNNAKGKAGK